MYPVIDMDRARKFYEEILELKVSKISEEGKWIEYDLTGGGCFAITNLVQGVQPSSDSGGSIAFEVENLDELMSQLKEKNVKVKLDIFSTPVCRLAVVVDSEGNAFTLHQLNHQ